MYELTYLNKYVDFFLFGCEISQLFSLQLNEFDKDEEVLLPLQETKTKWKSWTTRLEKWR